MLMDVLRCYLSDLRLRKLLGNKSASGWNRWLKDQIGEPPNLCIISDRHADFDKAISELRTYRPEAANKLEQTEALVHELSDWVAAKVYDRMLKSAKWTVKGIDPLQIYQVCNTKEGHQVDLLKFKCTCLKWKLSGISCNHVCTVCKVFGLTNCSLWAKPWFMKTTLKDTYQELVYPLKDPKLWETPNDLQVVLPPIMNKRPAGRPKNKDRIRSTNKAPTLAWCTGCGMNEHNQNGCNQPFPTNYATTKRRQEHLSQLLLKFHKDMNSYVIWDKDRMSTQEYLKELVEDVGEDEDFKNWP
nr:hypothetical protein [Tanacetum cinerariifolium]